MSQERSVRDVFGLYNCSFGGADGIRTHDLLDAIEARSQLRHGPTEPSKFTTGRFDARAVGCTTRIRRLSLRTSRQLRESRPLLQFIGEVKFGFLIYDQWPDETVGGSGAGDVHSDG